jgi:hypothetical protein
MEIGRDGAGGAAASAVALAFDAFRTGVDHLLKVLDDGGLDDVEQAGLLDFMHDVEQERNRLALIDHEVIRRAVQLDLPHRLCQGSMGRVLTSALRISKGEAARRVRAAAGVGPRDSMVGERLEPCRPHLAAAQRAGAVSPEQVDIVCRAIGQVDRRGFDAADVAVGEELLARHAATFGPEDLRVLAAKVVDAIDPDGTLPDDQLNEDRRHLHLRPTRDGAYVGEFRLTGSVGAKLKVLLDPLAKVRPPVIAADGRVADTDERHHGQRMHDALDDLCDRLLRTDQAIPETGGVPATVIVTIGVDDLRDRLGCGRTADGTLIPTAKVLALAEQAEIIPAVLNASGAVLELGRSRRIASRAQTLALYARDGGCSFPGCSHPPQYCERHHVVAWIEGGTTDVDNLTLLCRYHHHNFWARGWTCTINGDGLPEWTAPTWLSRNRPPMINTRIHGTLTARRECIRGRPIAANST